MGLDLIPKLTMLQKSEGKIEEKKAAGWYGMHEDVPLVLLLNALALPFNSFMAFMAHCLLLRCALAVIYLYG